MFQGIAKFHSHNIIRTATFLHVVSFSMCYYIAAGNRQGIRYKISAVTLIWTLHQLHCYYTRDHYTNKLYLLNVLAKYVKLKLGFISNKNHLKWDNLFINIRRKRKVPKNHSMQLSQLRSRSVLKGRCSRLHMNKQTRIYFLLQPINSL